MTAQTLYHYCSNAAFLSILESKEIWASEFSLSNDPTEGRWIKEVFTELCNDRGVSDFVKSLVIRQLDMVGGFFGACGFCMSEDGDLLSQWRAYAHNGAGISLGLNADYFGELSIPRAERRFNLTLQKVVYDVAKQKNSLSPTLDELLKIVDERTLVAPTLFTMAPEREKERKHAWQRVGLLFMSLFGGLHTLKNPGFSEEREWRLISHIIAEASELFQPMSEMEFRALEDRVIPFRRIPLETLDEPSLTEVVLGPRNITPPTVIEAVLEKHGWEGVNVRQSKASYRA